jgi:hypothetical protein
VKISNVNRNMKTHFRESRPLLPANSVSARNARFYRAVILLVSLSCGGKVLAQNTNSAAASTSPGSGGGTNVTKLEPVTVVGKLDVARNQIVPDLGATTYTINKEQLQALGKGENASFCEVNMPTSNIESTTSSYLKASPGSARNWTHILWKVCA